jgi:hypothetical protein
MPHRLRQQWLARPYGLVELECAVASQRSDPELGRSLTPASRSVAGFERHTLKAHDRRNIDHGINLGKSEIDQWHQTLPTCQELRIAILGQKSHCLLDTLSPQILEGFDEHRAMSCEL